LKTPNTRLLGGGNLPGPSLALLSVSDDAEFDAYEQGARDKRNLKQRLAPPLKWAGGALMVVVVLIVWALVSSLSQGHPSSKWVAYSSTEHGFRVQHPSNLAPTEKTQSDAMMVVFQAGESGVGEAVRLTGFNFTPTSIGLVVLTGPSMGGSPSQWLDVLREGAQAQPNYKQVDAGQMTMAGVTAQTLTIEVQEQRESGATFVARERYAAAIVGDRVFMLGEFAPTDEFDSAVFSRFVDSLQIT